MLAFFYQDIYDDIVMLDFVNIILLDDKLNKDQDLLLLAYRGRGELFLMKGYVPIWCNLYMNSEIIQMKNM
jgi:hypothetical protein